MWQAKVMDTEEDKQDKFSSEFRSLLKKFGVKIQIDYNEDDSTHWVKFIGKDVEIRIDSFLDNGKTK